VQGLRVIYAMCADVKMNWEGVEEDFCLGCEDVRSCGDKGWGVGQDKLPVLQRRGCDTESTMSCWRVRLPCARGNGVGSKD
jgi:hypothetical protein